MSYFHLKRRDKARPMSYQVPGQHSRQNKNLGYIRMIQQTKTTYLTMTLLAAPWRRLMSMIWPDTDLEASATVSNLLRLPPGIIMLIAGILPKESSVSLALSCRQLSHILGGKSWKSLPRAPHDAGFAFLSSLAKDLSQLFPCMPAVSATSSH